FNGEGACPDTNYTQSTWHVFTTDAHIDFLRFEVLQNSPWDAVTRNWGYRLYRGDARIDSIADGVPVGGQNLTQVTGCRTLTQPNIFNPSTNPQNQPGPPGAVIYPCDLLPNTTYSIQLYSPYNYNRFINVRLYELGNTASVAPHFNAIAPARQLGVLGTTQSTTDLFSCQGRLNLHPACDTVIPAAGRILLPDGVDADNQPDTLDLQTWFTFELNATTNVTLRNNVPGNTPNVLMRIFEGDVVADGCNALALFQQARPNNNTDHIIYCMPAGKYSVQLLGQSNMHLAHRNDVNSTNLARNVTTTISIGSEFESQFGLHADLEVDIINNGNPLAYGVTYNAMQDTFDCRTTTLPQGFTTCAASNDRAMYRLIQVYEDGVLYVSGGRRELYCEGVRYRLFRGDANALAQSGNHYGPGEEIPGLVDQAGCQSLVNNCTFGTQIPFKVCVTPGWYTLVTYGSPNTVGMWDRPWVRFYPHENTNYTDSLAPEAVPPLSASSGPRSATFTRFSCMDNANTFGGVAPCGNYTKAVYREIELTQALLVSFINNYSQVLGTDGGVQHRIYNGWKSDGSLGTVFRNCFGNFNDLCMPAGKYTVVTYGWGETFPSPTYTGNRGGTVYDQTGFTLTYNPNVQKYSTFATRDTAHRDSPVFWEPRTGHTAQIPLLHKTTNLDIEYFDCVNNLPFPTGITPCQPAHNRISYRVFTLTKSSHVYIYNTRPAFRSYQSRLYAGDIALLAPAAIAGAIVPGANCFDNEVRLCLSPGTYTLVTFAGNADIGASLSPRIYVDSLGTSQFDFANNAYNFGDIPNDNTWYGGNPSSPTDALGRPASTDFFFCNTGRHTSDPQSSAGHGCNHDTPRRNLWYTFTVTGPGEVFVDAKNRTIDKRATDQRNAYTVYQSLNSTFPLTEGDLAPAQLVEVARSQATTNWPCTNNEVSNFYIDPCSTPTTRRYYVVVDIGVNEVNTQLDVAIRFAPAPPAFVLFDDFADANIINGNPTAESAAPYTLTNLTAGNWRGFTGNLNCATEEGNEPYFAVTPVVKPCASPKTLWYGFDVGITGFVRINYDRPSATPTPLAGQYNANELRLYRQTDPALGIAGLVPVPLTTEGGISGNPDLPGTFTYGRSCVSPGRYYLMFTGCGFPTETVVPRLWLHNQVGDLCTDPLSFSAGGAPGTFFSPTAIVDCHTYGEGPGESLSGFTCGVDIPFAGKKTTWFRFNIDTTGIGRTDLDIRLVNNTTAPSTMLAWRLGYGDCAGLTYEACVPSADVDPNAGGAFITQNLRCRIPSTSGYYWVQAIMPETATGTLGLRLDMNASSDQECEPINPDLPRAGFSFPLVCAGDSVVFNNLSTTGADVTYLWDFGDGHTSGLQNPRHLYTTPAAWGTWPVKLVVTNLYGSDSITRTVTVYQKPQPAFAMSADNVCINQAVTFTPNVTETTPDVTYQWNFCAAGTEGVCGASTIIYDGLTPPAVSWSIPGRKVISLAVNNLNGCDSTLYDTVEVEPFPLAFAGPDKDIQCGDSTYIGMWDPQYRVYRMGTAAGSTAITYARDGLLVDHGGINFNVPTGSVGVRSYTLAPVAADSVEIVFTDRHTGGTFCSDQITIYAGPDATAPVIYGPVNVSAIPLNHRVVSHTGVMTVAHNINSGNCNGRGFIGRFHAFGTNPNTYTWSPATGLSGTNGPVVRAAPAATTTYTLTVTTPLGCQSTTQVTVNVTPNILAGADKSIVCGDSVYLGERVLPHGIVTMPQAAGARDTTRSQAGKLRDHANHLNVNAVIPHVGTRFFTIAPIGADSVELVFTDRHTSGTFCDDQLTVFEGYDEHAVAVYGPISVSAIPLGHRVVSRTGVLTVRHFINDNNCNGRGFEADFRSWGNFPDHLYEWTPAAGLSDPFAPNPKAAPAATTVYTLTFGGAGGCTDQVTVTVLPNEMAGPDVTIVCGDSTYLGVKPMPHGIVHMPVTLTSGVARDTTRNREGKLRDHANHLNVNAVTPHVGTRYMTIAPVGADSVAIVFRDRHTSGTFCGDLMTIFDGYDETAPILYGPVQVGSIPANHRVVSTWGVLTVRHMINDNTCNGRGFEADFNSYGTYPTDYSWSPTTGLSDPTSLSPRAAPSVTTTYTLTYGNGCSDQVTVFVDPLNMAGPDRIAGCGDSVYLGLRPMPEGIIHMPVTLTAGLARETFRNRSGILRDHANHLNVNAVTPHVGTRYTTLAPVGADSVEIVFVQRGTSGTFCNDQITIFDGYDETAPILYGPIQVGAIPIGQRVVSTWGVITVRHFINDNNCNGIGFEANFSSFGNFPNYYSWTPATGLSDPTALNPKAAPNETTTYTLTYGNGCTDEVTVFVATTHMEMAGPDVTISCGDSVYLGMRPMPHGILHMPVTLTAGVARDTTFNRSGKLRDHANHLNVNQVTPHVGTRFMSIAPVGADSVALVFRSRHSSGTFCADRITVFDGYDETAPILYGPIDPNLIPIGHRVVAYSGVMTVRHMINDNNCNGAGFEADFNSYGNFPDYFRWSPTTGLSDSTVMNPKAAPSVTTTYVLTYGGGCTDTVTVFVNPLEMAGPDVTISCGDSVYLGLKHVPHGILPMPLLAATNGTSRQTIRTREGKLRDHANHLNVNQVTPHVGTRYTTL
ncbi:MAG: PKD domain-containing protein, partial [Bacteroidetes bacterium]|nr:PKD domain-containing protein [Bacteroidota bacterium]